MNQPMVGIFECADRTEAETIRIRLAAAGISAFVRGDDAASSMAISGGGMGTGLVTVEVAYDDHERATQTLDEDRRRRDTLGPWICDGCAEENESSFDLCWNCANPRTVISLQTLEMEPAAPITVKPSGSVGNRVDSNPYRPTKVDLALTPRINWRGRFIFLAIIVSLLVTLVIWDAIRR